MARYDFAATRLYVDAPLASDAAVALTPSQAHYLIDVLRFEAARELIVFNGCDGEWRARLQDAHRKRAQLTILEPLRPQEPTPDLDYLFAPLKQARLDYMVQKAVEMGAGRLIPVITRRTQVSRINGDRLRANVVEAAEQCGILAVPRVEPEARLDTLLDRWTGDRLLVFCDEEAPVGDALAALRERGLGPGRPAALLIGPEGGFDPTERERILALDSAVAISLGPRILRADTAAVAALALINAVT